jgi:hypothetical protein
MLYRIIYLGLFLLFFLQKGIAQELAYQGNPDNSFFVARDLAFEGHHSIARDTLRLILSKYPDYTDVRNLLAKTYSWDGNHNEARKHFNKITSAKISLARRRPIYGIGKNDADYVTQIKINGKSVTCPAYQKWHNMIKRCYSAKFHSLQPTYTGCTVCDEWLTFSNFKKWFDANNVEGHHIDKDLKFPGNKRYSPETCLFLPSCINNLLVDHAAKRGDWPIGVSFDKQENSFQAGIKIDGKRRGLGRFSNPELAHEAYVTAKNKEIIRKSKQFPELAIYLKQYIKEI